MIVKSTSDICAEILRVLAGAFKEAPSKDDRDEIYQLLDRWREQHYNDGYGDGKLDAPKPEFAEVDSVTVDNIKLGISLLNSDQASARVYLDRAFKDFNESYP